MQKPQIMCFHLPEASRIERSREIESKLGTIRGWSWGVTAKGDEVSFGPDENVLELSSDDGCIAFTKHHWHVHVKLINSINYIPIKILQNKKQKKNKLAGLASSSKSHSEDITQHKANMIKCLGNP